MKNVKWFRISACLTVSACLCASATAAGGKSAVPQTSAKQTAVSSTAKSATPDNGSFDSRAETFLNEVAKADSLAMVQKAFEKGAFKEGELKELEIRSRKAAYKSKIEQLKKKAAENPKPPKPGMLSVGNKTSLATLKNNLKRKQADTISLLNKQAKAEIAGLVARRPAASSMSDRPKSSSALTVSGTMMFAGTTAALHSEVKITEMRPAVVTIGQELTINGSGFGSTKGDVSLAVDTAKGKGKAFACEIKSWSSRKIVVTIPLDCESVVTPRDGEGDDIGTERAWVRIKPAGDDPGSAGELKVTLDRARFTPEITTLSATDIHPGQIVIVEGKNLMLADKKPKVQFRFDERRFDVTPASYAFDYLEARLPENIDGLVQTTGTIEVTNTTGLSVRKTVTLIPDEEIVESISDEVEAHCEIDELYIFCLVGQTEESPMLHDWTLKNGWVVESAWLETDSEGLNSGAYYTKE